MADQRAVFAVDLGGTRMRGALISPEGDVLMRDAVPTQASRGEPAAMRRLAGLMERMTAALPDVEVLGIGMALAGPVDLAHPALANEGGDLVVSDATPDRQCHRRCRSARSRPGPSPPGMRGQHRRFG